METLAEIRAKLTHLGLGEEKYHSLPGPKGLPICRDDMSELEEIAKATAEFITQVDAWHTAAADNNQKRLWTGILQNGIPRSYCNLPARTGLPETIMIDTVWTTAGWRAVEIDATNRNGLGFPGLWRYVYDIAPLWGEVRAHWQSAGWSGVTQIMGRRQRFYEPFFRFFLKQVGGTLVREENLAEWLDGLQGNERILDLPILFESPEILQRLLETTAHMPVAIPPKHHLSSKAVLSLPWEVEEFHASPMKKFLPETRLLCKSRPLPAGDFFIKILQSGGAKGTFHNDHAQLEMLHMGRRPQAVWQEALPIAKRRITFFDEAGELREDDFHIRFSLYVTPGGKIADADVTASAETIVHGSAKSILTLPVLAEK